jgi:uncharacterized protein (DUF952 family)
MSIIMHIVSRKDWEALTLRGYYKPSSLNTDGFIHCSTIEQTAATADQFYSNQQGLILLCIDTNKTESEIKYEGPACDHDQRTELAFPHIYGPLNVSAVITIVDFPPKPDGKFDLPSAINAFRQ